MSDSVSRRGRRVAAHDSWRGGRVWQLGRCAAAWLALLLQGCHHVSLVNSMAVSPCPAVVFSRQPDGARPLSLRRALSVSTESTLSLWLRVVEGEPPSGRPHERVELNLLDVCGVLTTDAFVRPEYFLSDADGYSPPLTFLASEPGIYRIRVSFAGTSVYGPRIVVSGEATKVREVRRCGHL
jgi:hypothetical protein